MSDKIKSRLKGAFGQYPKVDSLFVAGGQVFFEKFRAEAYNSKVEEVKRSVFLASLEKPETTEKPETK